MIKTGQEILVFAPSNFAGLASDFVLIIFTLVLVGLIVFRFACSSFFRLLSCLSIVKFYGHHYSHARIVRPYFKGFQLLFFAW